ncbi:MFS transporter [Bryobacterales bacterium F-183]|nr:MFS transporter [Bryobacterales bacterium F-183]
MTVASESSPSYHGWKVVAAGALGAMVSFGSLFVYTFSVFLKPLTAEFGWSREEASRGFAVAALSVAVASPLLGRALDRMAPRKILLPAFVIFGCGVAALSLLQGSLAQFYLTLLVIGLFANATTQMGYSGAVSSWFTKRRGVALALVTGGVGVGSMLHPLLSQWMISNYGWRAAYLLLGGMILVCGIPLTALWVRRRPAVVASKSLPEKPGASVREALASREFWFLVLTLFLSSMAANGSLTHMAAHLTDRGLTPGSAALVTGLLGAANLIGRFLTGWLLDRYSGPRLSFVLLILMAMGMMFAREAASLPVAILSAILIGIGLGGEADVTPYLLSRYFGLLNFSLLYGLTWTFYALAGAAGPVVFGRVFDQTGSYALVLMAGAGLTVVSAIFMLLLREPKPLVDSSY